jgi:hypothetical protein
MPDKVPECLLRSCGNSSFVCAALIFHPASCGSPGSPKISFYNENATSLAVGGACMRCIFLFILTAGNPSPQ